MKFNSSHLMIAGAVLLFGVILLASRKVASERAEMQADDDAGNPNIVVTYNQNGSLQIKK